MTQDEIIELAIQGHASTRDAIRWAMNQAILAEREACAKVCEEFSNIDSNMSQAWRNGCRECAVEIRERRSNT